MSKKRAEFIARFLYTIREDDYYWVSGTPPTQHTIDDASSAAKDHLGFNDHREHFEKLAEVIDSCTAEELESHGNGIAARNATKHPAVVSLSKAPPEQRAGVAAAAAQGLAWMEDCRKWVDDCTLRNQIAKRVMAGFLLRWAELNLAILLGKSLRW